MGALFFLGAPPAPNVAGGGTRRAAWRNGRARGCLCPLFAVTGSLLAGRGEEGGFRLPGWRKSSWWAAGSEVMMVALPMCRCRGPAGLSSNPTPIRAVTSRPCRSATGVWLLTSTRSVSCRCTSPSSRGRPKGGRMTRSQSVDDESHVLCAPLRPEAEYPGARLESGECGEHG